MVSVTVFDRYTMSELEGFVAEAKRCVPGTAEAIVAAQSLKAHPVGGDNNHCSC